MTVAAHSADQPAPDGAPARGEPDTSRSTVPWRVMAVVVGPSLVADLLAGASLLLWVLSLFVRPAGGPLRALRRPAALGSAATLAYLVAVRPWQHRWGATDAEVRAALPGDQYVPRARSQSTRAVTVAAPAAEVWRWLVQFGQGRAGFYSYNWLENLARPRALIAAYVLMIELPHFIMERKMLLGIKHRAERRVRAT
jgi:hypothetical protein